MSIGPRLGGGVGAALLFAGLALWGLFGWAFPIVQQARLVTLDPAMAPITLSLNISALYVGVAIGSSLGAWAIARWSVDSLGLVAGASEIVALVWLALTGALKPRPRRRRPDVDRSRLPGDGESAAAALNNSPSSWPSPDLIPSALT